jgi:hypothetical protein
MSAKHYQLFRSENAQNRSPETGGQFAKARHWRTPFYEYLGQFLRAPDCLAGGPVLIVPVSRQIPS